MKTETVQTTSLKLAENNPRYIRDDKFKKLVKSIEEFPEMLKLRPIVVDEEMTVLGGNMRLRACLEIGIETVPIIKAKNLTEEQKQEFVIKDNVGFGEWDWDILANEWDATELSDWGMDLPDEWDVEPEPEAKEDEYEIPNQINTTIQTGDLIEIGDHRLLCGDSTDPKDYAKLMKSELADMVLTDPPYNVDYEGGTGLKIMNDKMDGNRFYSFLLSFYKAQYDYTKEGGAWYVFHADSEGVNFRTAFEDCGLLLKQCLIWVKNTFVMGRQDYHWKHEPCLYGWKSGAGHYFTDDRTQTTVIEDQIDIDKLKKNELKKIVEEMLSEKQKTSVIHCDKPSKNDVHPTMKPILLIAPMIENSSKRGEVICDPFLGSGSTMVAAHQLQRKCYGMELDPKYCQVIVDRMKELEPNIEIKKNGEKM